MANQMQNGRTSAPEWLRSSVRSIEGNDSLDQVAGQMAMAAEPLTQGSTGDALRGRWLGHALHPLLTDFPLGCWLSAGLLDLLGGRKSRPAAQRLIGLGLAFTLPTAAAGAADWSAAQGDDPKVRRIGVVHALGNIVVGMLYFRSWRARRQGHHLRGMGWSTLGGTLAWGTAWLGGHMAIALGAARGERGFGEDGPSTTSGGGVATPGAVAGVAASPNPTGDGELLDLREASDRLGVPVEQVQAMVDQGVLVPATAGAGPSPRFRDTDVEAVRLLGG